MFKKKQNNNAHYKFQNLLVYNSTEWLYNNEKKYRQIFDESECSYIYAELTLVNKLFDEEDWEADVEIKIIEIGAKKEKGIIKHTLKATQDKVVLYVREGWGNPQIGSYWRKGSYKFIAFVDGEQIAEKAFYIVNKGLVSEAGNPYFNIRNIHLYEGPEKTIPKEERVYLSQFSQQKTRYIWTELDIDNLVEDIDPVPIEIYLRYYNDASQLKGSLHVLRFINPGDKEINISEGWGSEKAGTWFKDDYTLEIIFMDQLIAVVPFRVGEKSVMQGEDFNFEVADEYKTFQGDDTLSSQDNDLTFEEAVAGLNELIGLKKVKGKIHEYASYLNFLKIRKEKGFKESGKINLHAVFMGNPGTGKTTVARQLGAIYKSLGMLSRGHVHEVDRAMLVAKFIGQTAPQVKAAIEQARGGILFIDEAYSLTNKGSDSDFGPEVIEVLMKEMSDGPGNIAIIAAGYTGQMNEFLASNPGLHSRFNMIIEFPDYTPEELMQIASFSAQKRDVTLQPEAVEFLSKKVINAYRQRDHTFGNARFINSVIDESKMNLGLRIMSNKDRDKLSAEDLSSILLVDIEKSFSSHEAAISELPIDEELLSKAMDELRSMQGLMAIKNEIEDMVKLVKYYREIGRDIRKAFSLHSVFTGNPGTGKTTVARILVTIYKALGILERGHLVECDREKLVAAYVGQTAIKTSELIDKAIGGGLFIDEAYALEKGSIQDFGREAVETLLKRMEDQRGQFVVIVAGYPVEMNRFLESNPGLKSRFDRFFQFEDFDAETLNKIAINMFAQEGLKPDEYAARHLLNYFNYLYQTKNRFFGNARTVRKIVEEIIKKQHLRMASITKENRTNKLIKTVVMKDVEHLTEDKTMSTKTIGFKFG